VFFYSTYVFHLYSIIRQFDSKLARYDLHSNTTNNSLTPSTTFHQLEIYFSYILSSNLTHVNLKFLFGFKYLTSHHLTNLCCFYIDHSVNFIFFLFFQSSLQFIKQFSKFHSTHNRLLIFNTNVAPSHWQPFTSCNS